MFVATKPCTFSDQKFLVGDVVPDTLVDPKAVSRLVKMNVLSVVPEQKPQSDGKSIVPVYTEKGTLEIELNQSDLTLLFTILQSKATDATKAVKAIKNNDLLICIDAIDTRKAVQTAAKETAMKLQENA